MCRKAQAALRTSDAMPQLKMGVQITRRAFGTCLAFTLLLLLSPVHSAQQRVLVLLQTLDAKSTYSGFFNALEAQGGLQLEYKSHKDSTLRLKEYGVWQYEHLILLTPKAEGGLAQQITIRSRICPNRECLRSQQPLWSAAEAQACPCPTVHL